MAIVIALDMDLVVILDVDLVVALEGVEHRGGRGWGVRSQDIPADQVNTIEEALPTIGGT